MLLNDILSELSLTPVQACGDLRAVLRVVQASDEIIKKIEYASDWRRKRVGPRVIQNYISVDALAMPLNIHPDNPVIDEIEEIQAMIDNAWLASLSRVEQLLQKVVVDGDEDDGCIVYFDEARTDWSPRALMFCHDRISKQDARIKRAVSDSFEAGMDTTDYRMLKVMSKRRGQFLTRTQWKMQFRKAKLYCDEKTITDRAKLWKKMTYVEHRKRKDGSEGKHGLAITPKGFEHVKDWVDPNPKEVNIE